MSIVLVLSIGVLLAAMAELPVPGAGEGWLAFVLRALRALWLAAASLTLLWLELRLGTARDVIDLYQILLSRAVGA